MNRYIKNLKSFLAEQPPNFRFDDANSILEVLCYFYCVANAVDSGVIHCQFHELNDILSKLSLDENDAVFSITADLCAEHTRRAFLDGVYVGMHLFDELSELPCVSPL